MGRVSIDLGRRSAGLARGLTLVAVFAVLGAGAACAERPDGPGDASFIALDTLGPPRGQPEDTIPGSTWTWADWDILEQKMHWSESQGLNRMPFGEGLALLGVSFVGTTYTPGTLEAPGPEHLVINLRELDCVTFIENLLALSWLSRNEGVAILADRPRAMERFEQYLTAVRYRDGVLTGYPSRLHYFSDWMSNNAAMGVLELRTRELGGVADPEPIAFMSEHRDSYRQLAENDNFEAIRRIEQQLNAEGPRYYIPQGAIRQVENQIQNGDVIATTSTVAGLDIAHTGIALWQDGRLHLLHAPLVGRNVEISERPLAERIQGFSGQDGIMVATPQEWPAGAANPAPTP